MSSHICKLLENTPSGTAIKELMMNGEDVSSVDEFVKYDKRTDLAYFTNKSNSVFVGICNKIDMIEFEFVTEEQGDKQVNGTQKDEYEHSYIRKDCHWDWERFVMRQTSPY